MNEEKYFNRELSWLSFNYRVLQEAKDQTVPLYERIKFLAIYSSNLDEFFRVRVASLRSLLDLKKKKLKKLSINPEKLLKDIQKTVHRQQEEFGFTFREEIIPQLKENNIHLVKDDELFPEQVEFVNDYFRSNIFAHVQPVLIEKNNISIFLKNRSIYLAARIQKEISDKKDNPAKKKRSRFALVEIPAEQCGRFLTLPVIGDNSYIMFMDDVLRLCIPQLFPGYDIIETYSVKLTRDAELYIDDEFTGNLLEKIKKSLSKRTTGAPCRFLYDHRMPKDFLKYLRSTIGLSKDDILPGGRYHNFHDFFSFPNPFTPKLEYDPMPPLNSNQLDASSSVFDLLKRKDVLLHYPYQSYDYVINFLAEAATDPDIKSIKITLYRAAAKSKIIKALIDASKNGKSVTAFVEVKARFDEESNFQNAEEMEKAGIKVLYSFPGLKVHSKICLIKRTEENREKLYAYFSTGNFNEKSARVYSDIGFFTADESLTSEAAKIFNFLCKKSEKEEFSTLMAAPFNLRESFYDLVDNEIIAAQEGRKAYIILKLNSIEDKRMIKKLYEASNAGVKIRIIVRGICCLIPGVKNMSSNIKVTSIVDRFLEHSRIYIFCNSGDEKIFAASADLMTRNLSRRVEICFPVVNEALKKEINYLIRLQLNDNVKSRIINKTQSNPYKKSRSAKVTRAQLAAYDFYKSKAAAGMKTETHAVLNEDQIK